MRIHLQEGGLLQIPARLLKRFRLTVEAAFGLVAPHRRMMWLIQEPDRIPDGATIDQLKLAGFVSSVNVADLFSLLNMGQRTGALLYLLDDSEKTVYFEKGEILFATSTFNEDRLGQVLLRLGKLTEGQLREADSTLKPGIRFGHHLIQHGFLAAETLGEAVRYQVEEILYSLFTMEEGVFMFFENANVSQDLVQFTLNTQNILMEGFQRVDEWQVLRRKITSDEVVPERTDKDIPDGYPDARKAVLDAVDGARNISSLLRVVGRGAFPVYKALYEADKEGLVKFREEEKQEVDKGSGSMIQDFNRLYRTVAMELQKHTETEVPRAFAAFVAGLPKATKEVLQDVPVQEDGTLDLDVLRERVAAAVSSKGTGGLMAGVGDLIEQQTVLGALNETLNFYLMTARKMLPAQRSERLIAAIRNVHKNLLAKYKT